ncbi:hypothetical protein ACFYTG_08330 [Streptomyces mirabilis]|uniref:recombination directionality factor n=1 Tax=Streptomyces mirabilis TaxID=68239 RepID=UPI0036C4A142
MFDSVKFKLHSRHVVDNRPEVVPKPRANYSDGTVGRFHSGRQVDNQPESLSEWRITTGERHVADAVAQLFGGVPDETDSPNENFIEILTAANAVPVILDGVKAIRSDMKLWNRSKLVHHCDGVEFLSPDEKAGRPCGCPALFAERKQAAKDYVGPSPSISITFRLADDPDLGAFRFQSSSWMLAEEVGRNREALSLIDGPAICELALELVTFATKKGRLVSYVKPVLAVSGPWESN